MQTRITDNSNNAISGAQSPFFGQNESVEMQAQQTLIGWATPATTSAVTYKGRFLKHVSGTASIANDNVTGQMYAIEVSA